jgi:cbb3-type cytochrome oxidase maturation protein
MLIYVIGSFLMAGISIGFVVWGFKTGQFGENPDLNRKVLEEDEEEA